MKRYPLEPLQALTRSRDTGLHMSHGEIAAAIGDITASGVQAWGKAGIPAARAEQAAVALGFDPYNVWPEMLEDVSKVCAHETCNVVFVPALRNPHQKYCSAKCRQRAHNRTDKEKERRRKYQRAFRMDPEVQERNRQARRAYYRENRDYELKRNRAYYWRLKEAG